MLLFNAFRNDMKGNVHDAPACKEDSNSRL